MTTEEKQLLLRDLCARLPYKVRALYYGSDEECYTQDAIESIDITCTEPEILIGQYGLRLEDVKPYLRPMSSMTKEERLVYEQRLHDVGRSVDVIDADDVEAHIDWLLSNHFDFRGLIPKGLALVALDGMYKTE